MPIMNRRRASCFFCSNNCALGPSTKFHKNGRPSYFECPHCGADNHLDQSGVIVDYVPSTPERDVPHFAHPVRPVTPPPATATAELPSFCRNCQTNQNIIYQAVAEYAIPSEDSPDYRYVVEEKLPAYMKELEQKWPPICARCEPRVSKKIRESNYHAKVMGLAQMRVRTDATQSAKPRDWGPGKVVWVVIWALRGVVWVVMNGLFLGWHFSVAFRAGGEKVEEAMDNTSTWGKCLWNSYDRLEMDPACFDVTSEAVRKYALLSIVGIAWMYRQLEAERHKEKKLVGFADYIKVEGMVLLIRLASWWWLLPGATSLSPHVYQRIHVGLLFVTVLLFLYSSSCVRLEDPPVVSLRESGFTSPPLSPGLDPEDQIGELTLEPASFRAPTPKRPTQPFPSETPRASSAGPQLQPFSLPPPDLHSYREHRSVSPARTEFSDADAMDWSATTPYDSPIRPQYSTASPFASIPSLIDKPNTTSFAGGNNVFAAMRQQMQPQASPTKGLPPIRGGNFSIPERYKKPPLAPARFKIPPARNDEDDVLTSMMGGRLTLRDADAEDDSESETHSQSSHHHSSPANNNSTEITHESVTTMTIRLLSTSLACALTPTNLRIWWFAPCLIALVWRGGMEGASPSNLTMLASAIVTALAGFSGMVMEVESKKGVIGGLALAALGLVAVTEVWGIFERISKEKRRRWWRDEEARVRRARVRERERSGGRGSGGGGGGGGGVFGDWGAVKEVAQVGRGGVQEESVERTPVRRSRRVQEQQMRQESPVAGSGARSGLRQQGGRGRKRESGGLGFGGLAL